MKNVYCKWMTVAGMVLSLAAVSGSVSALRAQNADIAVHDAWARVPPGAATQTSIYLVVENHGKSAHSIVSVSTDVADKAELHESQVDKATKMMSMPLVAQIGVPANGKAMLQPGGYHIMIYGLKKKLMAGDMVNLTLKVDDGSSLPVAATVKDASDDMGGGMGGGMKKK